VGIFIVCLYGKTIKYDFIGLDDKELIVENIDYISDFSNLANAFTTHAFYNPKVAGGSNVYYRPMLTLSFMLDSKLGGVSPKYYHITNILLHLIATLLLLKLLVVFKLNEDLAFFFALLFAAHPMLSQAVGWVPGRNDSLLAVFIIAGFIFLIKYLASQNNKYLFFHILFIGLSLFTKESAVAFPVVCIFYFLFFKYSSKQFVKPLWALIAGYLIVFLPWYFLRKQVMEHAVADLSFSSLSKSFIENLPLVLQYFQKSVLPYNLSVLSVPKDTNILLCISLLAILMFFVVRSKDKNWKVILFGFTWFLAFLLPAFVVHILTGFEHRVYLPMIGLLLVVSEITEVKRFSLKNSKQVLVGLVVIAAFSIATVRHSNSFSSGYEFWKTAATNSDNSALARMNYGLALSQNGETQQAIEIYKEGLSINPNEPLIHNNLGIVYARNKMPGLAEQEFKKELEVNPLFSDAHYNLGLVYAQTGRDSLMFVEWNEALRMDPNNARVKKALSMAVQNHK